MSDGVLLTAHGTIAQLSELPEFLARIRHGRPAPPEFVAELRGRYERIGGSPLLATTRAQASSLSSALGVPVYVGMRLWNPSNESALRDAAAAGVTRLAVVALAPFSQHVYWDAVVKAREATGLPLELRPTPAWGEEPEFVEGNAELVREALARAPNAELVLSAHSLPEIAIQRGDPYARLVEATARAIGARLGRAYRLCFQSQGEGGGAWLGPGVTETLRAVASSGKHEVVWAPFGFLADHVETLYDLDVEAAGIARDLGLELRRVPALNDHPRLTSALAGVVRRALEADSPNGAARGSA